MKSFSLLSPFGVILWVVILSLALVVWGIPTAPASVNPPPGSNFTIVVLPDTQKYSASYPDIFDAQTQWIVDNRAAKNIVYVAHVGDIVDDGDTVPNQWSNAATAMYKLDDASIPYGFAVGNCDQDPRGDPSGTTAYFNQYFGVAHFSGRSYYGGYYYGGYPGHTNDNHYDLFSASGLDFIVVYFEYDTNANPAVLAWADNLLKTYSNRRAIVVNHFTIDNKNPGPFSTQGQAIYDALKDNPNLFLMLAGHVDWGSSRGQRQDVYNGQTVYTWMADYQAWTNGGNGYLRLLEFQPDNNLIQVKTYSPYLDQYQTGSIDQFAVSYDMGGGAPTTNAGLVTNNAASSTYGDAVPAASR